MCYSGRCRWEDYMGDCRFPDNFNVRDKYPLPVCDIPTCVEEVEYLEEVYADIRKILKDEEEKYGK